MAAPNRPGSVALGEDFKLLAEMTPQEFAESIQKPLRFLFDVARDKDLARLAIALQQAESVASEELGFKLAIPSRQSVN